MGQTVYADLYFMINFSMDFLCFFLTSRLLSRRLFVFRAVLASALGGLYAIAVLFVPASRIAALFIDMAVCSLMCAIAFFKRKRFGELLCAIPVYIAVSMVLGGFMTALFNLFNRLFPSIEEVEASDGISAWVFAVIACLSGISVMLGGRFFSKRGLRRYADITVVYGEASVTIRGMCDSGNLMRDAVSGRACVIADVKSVRGVIPDEILRIAESGDYGAMSGLGEELLKRTRLIPSKTVNGEGITVAFLPHSVTVEYKNSKKEVDVYVVLADIGNTADGSRALLPSELLI